MYARITLSLALLAFATVANAQTPWARNGFPVSHNLPPASMLLEPGPGVGGPGPGVLSPGDYMNSAPANGGYGGMMMGGMGGPVSQAVQVLFDKPETMNVLPSEIVARLRRSFGGVPGAEIRIGGGGEDAGGRRGGLLRAE